MNADRLFLDTAYVQALLSRRDRYHERALRVSPRARAAWQVWTTETVLLEVGNALSTSDRAAAAAFIRDCYASANMRVVPLTSELLLRGLDLYRDRPDKEWGLTDCISLVVMADEGLADVLTSDHHFVQAGHRALLLE